jgi:hypothetical protein
VLRRRAEVEAGEEVAEQALPLVAAGGEEAAAQAAVPSIVGEVVQATGVAEVEAGASGPQQLRLAICVAVPRIGRVRARPIRPIRSER